MAAGDAGVVEAWGVDTAGAGVAGALYGSGLCIVSGRGWRAMSFDAGHRDDSGSPIHVESCGG